MANKKLNAIITIGGKVSGTLMSAFSKTSTQIGKLSGETAKLTGRQQLLSKAIQTFARQGKNVDTLREKYKRVGEQIDALKNKQDRLNRSMAFKEKLNVAGDKLRSGSTALAAGGAATGALAMVGINENKRYDLETARIQALGLGNDATDHAVEFAKALTTFGTSQVEKLSLMRDAMSVFGDEHHAQMVLPTLSKMKFANSAMFGAEQGEENERQFMDMLKVIELRGGTKDVGAFNKQANYIQQVISATGGRVGASQWRDVIQTGGLAAKSMDNEKFYYQLEPLIQEMGGHKVGTALMSGYSGLYQGRTTKRAAENMDRLGLISDKSQVEYDKAGQVAHINPGALLGADTFVHSQFDWVTKVLVPQLKKKGYTSQKDILKAIGSIVSSRTAADLLSTMYLQEQQVEKSARVSSNADNIDQLDEKAKTQAGGRELDLHAKRDDAELKLGSALLPEYIKALTTVTDLLKKFNDFTDKNPDLVKKMSLGLGGAAVTMTGLATGGFVLSHSLNGISLVAKGVWGVMRGLGWGFRVATTAIRFLSIGLYGLAVRAIPAVIGGIRFMTMALMANPIGAAVTVIAGAAILIYANWDKLRPMFVQLWDAIKATFNTGVEWVSGLVDKIPAKWDTLKTYFASLWADILATFNDAVGKITGVIDSVFAKWDSLKSTVSDAASNLWNSVKHPFGGSDDPAPATTSGKTGAPAPINIPPMATSRSAAGSYTDNSKTEINVTQQPGEDSKALARRIAAEQERQRQIRQNSMMPDGAAAQ